MKDESRFPGLKVNYLTPWIRWEFYKHWGQGVYAGEGRVSMHGDRSGCVHVINGLDWTDKPIVAQARLYESEKGGISAVYSYPNGLVPRPDYFWEIYDAQLLPDVERFDTEAQMEARVIELLG